LGNEPSLVVPGLPKWVTGDSPRFDIVAKTPAAEAVDVGNGVRTYALDDVQAVMRTLLMDRFKIKVHHGDWLMDAHTLVAVKPKLKQADPANRTVSKAGAGAEGSGSRCSADDRHVPEHHHGAARLQSSTQLRSNSLH
jgi:uncharacterized protein (TIGR03435 family)